MLIHSAVDILQTKMSSHCPFSRRFGMLIMYHMCRLLSLHCLGEY